MIEHASQENHVARVRNMRRRDPGESERRKIPEKKLKENISCGVKRKSGRCFTKVRVHGAVSRETVQYVESWLGVDPWYSVG